MERLDRFELIADIASGGMATVYLARLGGVGGFQRLYAIKRLHPHLAKDREFVEMFLDEARLAARIHHPNVVPIHEIGTSERGYYLVMDYVEGDTQARLLAKAAQSGHKIAPAVGIRIALDTLAGLHAAHELRDDGDRPLEIVHRDVSPQNVLVGVDGVARITDFGVARAVSRLSTTRTGQLKGKLSYMAPEQARSKTAVDRRADVFAMGIVLWETLACRRLFKGENDAETLNRLLYEEIPTLRSAAPTVPASLDAIVMKALAREPDDRFATAADLAEALENAASSLKVLGSQRDVAACMQAVMGTELEQQREAVRAWISRSEPSSNGPTAVSVSHESVTKIEPRGSTLPPAVSSVSSMVNVPLPPPPAPGALVRQADEGPRSRPAPRKGRTRMTWSVTLAATSMLLASAVIAWRGPSRAPPTSAASPAAREQVELAAAPTTAPDRASVTAPAPAPPPEPAFPGPSPALHDAGPRDAASGVHALEQAEAPRPVRHRRAQAPSPPPVQAVQPTQTAQTAPAKPEGDPPAVPDDITRNPYR